MRPPPSGTGTLKKKEAAGSPRQRAGAATAPVAFVHGAGRQPGDAQRQPGGQGRPPSALSSGGPIPGAAMGTTRRTSVSPRAASRAR